MSKTLLSAVGAATLLALSALPALAAPDHNQNVAYVSALYRDVLGRPAGYDGINTWVPGLDNGSKSRADVAKAFVTSDEYRKNRVRDMFSAYLHRGISDYDLATFIKNGGSLRSLRVTILTSQEYFRLHGANARGWINGLYQDLLGRRVEYGGADVWVRRMNQGSDRNEIVNEIYGSPEALGRIVDSLFVAFLKRPADSAAKSASVQAMMRGTTEEETAVGLLTSAEYVNRSEGGPYIVQPPFGFGNQQNNPGQYRGGDNAQFVGQNVPQSMLAGQNYQIAITLRNTGGTQWDPSTYSLNVYPDGTPTWSVLAVPVPAAVNPGNSVTFTFSVIAPPAPGTYDFRWQLRRAGVGFFGDVTQDMGITVAAPRTY